MKWAEREDRHWPLLESLTVLRQEMQRVFFLSLLPYHSMSIPARFLITITENEVKIKESSQKVKPLGESAIVTVMCEESPPL